MPTLATPSYGSVLLHLMRKHFETGELLEIGTATGHLVNAMDGFHLVTNWHVVTGYKPDGEPAGSSAAPPTFVDVDFHNPDDLTAPATHRYPLYDDGRPLWRVHPSLGKRADIAALAVSFGGQYALHLGRTVSAQSYELDYSHEMALEPSMDVSVIGYPYGRKSSGSIGIWVRGTIASEPDLNFEGAPVFLVDCRSREGQSGSPVIAYRPAGSLVHHATGHSTVRGEAVWQLLGVYSGRISDESDLGKVWKLSAVREVVEHGAADDFEWF
ncbi:trypsin-like peptidase domain-containing protein [Microbacterium laevaniformans]|uniref:trypsin-like peptidase domain-containing protein n=1 Tax=Microbacterium laevaniformans TaxID=36807 RepID=UPI003D997DE9